MSISDTETLLHQRFDPNEGDQRAHIGRHSSRQEPLGACILQPTLSPLPKAIDKAALLQPKQSRRNLKLKAKGQDESSQWEFDGYSSMKRESNIRTCGTNCNIVEKGRKDDPEREQRHANRC